MKFLFYYSSSTCYVSYLTQVTFHRMFRTEILKLNEIVHLLTAIQEWNISKILKINSEASIALINLLTQWYSAPQYFPQWPKEIHPIMQKFIFFIGTNRSTKIHTLYEHKLWHYLVPNQYIYHTFHQLSQTAADLLMPRWGDTSVILT